MLAGLLAAGWSAALQQTVFRAEVAVVRLDVQVTENGRAVTGLTEGDFVVRDEGVPQRILHFAHEAEPLDVLLLLDASGSMRRHLGRLARAVRRAVRPLRPGDRVGVMFFSRRTATALEFTEDRGALERVLQGAARPPDLGSGTAINASILAAVAYVRAHGGRGRRAILIVTDNEGLNYQRPDEEVVRALWGADCVLSAAVTLNAAPPQAPPAGVALNPDFTPSDVFRLAAETGGEALRAEAAGEAFARLMEGLRARYSLQYRAPEAAPGSLRRITVDLAAEARRRHPGAVVVARRGYYTAP